jgi:hypothetical protein
VSEASKQSDVPAPRAVGRTDELRRMVLLLETAEVLEARARRTSDPAQTVVLLRRAEQRRQQAARLREGLAALGAVSGARSGAWPRADRSSAVGRARR